MRGSRPCRVGFLAFVRLLRSTGNAGNAGTLGNAGTRGRRTSGRSAPRIPGSPGTGRYARTDVSRRHRRAPPCPCAPERVAHLTLQADRVLTAAPAQDVTPRPPTGPRNGFLDTLRAVALVRVVLWHTLAFTALSWLVAAMPAMFFVGGSLLARSMHRHRWTDLLRTRLRRLLLPFWVYAAVVVTVLVLVGQVIGRADTAFGPWQLLTWLIPVVDPQGPAWEQGWATAPLWYLRCYLWLLLLSPLLRAVHRRWGFRSLLAPLAGVVVVDVLTRHPGVAPAGFDAVRFYLGDLACFAFFWMLGFSHADGVLDGWTRRTRLAWAALGGVGAVGYVAWTGPSDLVVNNHYPLLVLVGVGWLGLFLAAERWIAGLVGRRGTGPVVYWLGRRSLTVYLWHPVAIVGAFAARQWLAPDAPVAVVLPLVLLLTTALTVLFGRIEDHAARRPAQWWPTRDPVPAPQVRRPWLAGAATGWVAALAVVTVAAGTTAVATASPATTGTGLRLPPAPSGRPDPLGTDTTPDDRGADGDTAGQPPLAAPDDDDPTRTVDVAALTPALQSTVDYWRLSHRVAGVELGVRLPDGSSVTVTSGTDVDGAPLDLQADFPITSITKSMTAAAILQLAEIGALQLDDPLPEIEAVPGLPYVGRVTVRQLLNHTAGVLPYTESAGFEAVRDAALTPVTALELIRGEPLQWEPGSQAGYSNSGYLTLGLLAEQLTGAPYADVLRAQVFARAGMTATDLDETPTAGWVGFSAGGVRSTVDDLLAYGDALFRRGEILGADALTQMLDFDNDLNIGLGAYAYCPCGHDAGTDTYSSFGHYGGQTALQYAPAQDVVIALNLTQSLWTDELGQADVADLLLAVERLAAI